MRYIDLRSDTVTQPTQAMRDAMAHAPVGDDVFQDDPTINELETYAAQLLGKEAALFVTSGMQGNACALMAWTRRGDCVVTDPHTHIAEHEAGSYAQLSGVSLRHPQSVNGTMDPDSVRACLTDDSDVQIAPVTLITMENAHSSGAVLPLENMRAVYAVAQENHIPVHLDGARLFNAAAVLGISDVREMTQYCDSVMCCLSKGLCAPVGSILAGPKDLIHRARRARRILGGGTRQGGILAAAGLIALRDMTGRLTEDHENAAYLGKMLHEIPGVSVLFDRLDIDMVFFHTDWDAAKAARFPGWMLEHGVKVTGCFGGEYRMVCHHDVSRADCDTTIDLMRTFAAEG
ncbi:threonine aldolase family protein [Agathobaculum desmolans]|mgnify:CR=1 FL=1|uniref:threonine aldolase family protein n=1 Tax=Agathobaculum desmolans TaxID=39484 RepID=UPI0004E1388E|nr:GntG family PLP-dependent aldolase [Agathobaculum desmolans]